MHVLFVTVDGGGNLPPALGIAREIVRQGGSVRFLGHEAQRAAIEGVGLPFEPVRRGRDYEASAPRSTLRGLRDLTGVFADRGIGQDAIAAARAEPTDAVVVDCLLWGALDETVKAGLPVAVLVHSLWGYFRGVVRGPVGAIGRMRGVNPVAALEAPRLALVATRPEFEPDPPAPTPPAARHVGFVRQGELVQARSDPERPRVLVSFSTTHFPGQDRALQSVLDALEGLPVEVVATTGSIDPATLRVPSGMTVVRRRDHGEILPETALVVGHGGHATTARTLGHGIPLLVMPMHPLLDQPAVGRAVARLGVGRTLSKSARPAAIRDAVTALLADGAVRGSARRLGAQIRAEDGAAVAVEALAEMLRTAST